MASGGSGDGSGLERLLAGSVDALPAGRLAEQLEEGNELRVKFGMDPTSADIHLGHCVVLQKLRDFQDLGHVVELIVGDYTSRVGDPSGREEGRPVISPEQIAENAQTYQEQAFKVLDRERTEIRHNSEWLGMPSAELFDLIRRFTVARLLERDDFQRRMELNQGISSLELLYPVLQGYDSVAVEADVELGGTDQLFNLLMGREVMQAYGLEPQLALTVEYLVAWDGLGMSASRGNYIGLKEAPEEQFGKAMRIPDSRLEQWYRLVMEQPPPEGDPLEAKLELARYIVTRGHGEEAAARAEEHFTRVVRERQAPDDVPDVQLPDGDPVHLPALLAESLGIGSTSEARRLIAQGGVRVNGEVVSEVDVPRAALAGALVQAGKRRFARLTAP